MAAPFFLVRAVVSAGVHTRHCKGQRKQRSGSHSSGRCTLKAGCSADNANLNVVALLDIGRSYRLHCHASIIWVSIGSLSVVRGRSAGSV